MVANIKHAAKWQVNNIDRGGAEGEAQFVKSLFGLYSLLTILGLCVAGGMGAMVRMMTPDAPSSRKGVAQLRLRSSPFTLHIISCSTTGLSA